MSGKSSTARANAVQDLVTLLEPLLAVGWCVAVPDVPGDLRLERAWQGEQSAVSDKISIRRGGFAEGTRDHVFGRNNRTVRDQLFLSRGTTHDVIDGFLAEPDPHGHASQPQSMPLGVDTLRVQAFFHVRLGWECMPLNRGGLHYAYRLGVGEVELERPRLEQYEGLGIVGLACKVSPELSMRIEPWRVRNGCSSHRGADTVPVGFDDPAVWDILGSYELAARTPDLRALAHCLVYGPCSMRDTQSFAENDDGETRSAEALALLDGEQWSIRSVTDVGRVAYRRWPDGSIDLLSIAGPFQAYGLRVDADSWVVWKDVGLVEALINVLPHLAAPGEWGAPTERLFPASPEDLVLLAFAHGGTCAVS